MLCFFTVGKSLSAPVPSLRAACSLPQARLCALRCSQWLGASHLQHIWSKGPSAAREVRSCYQIHRGAGRKVCACLSTALFGLGRGMLSPAYPCTWGMSSAGKSKSTEPGSDPLAQVQLIRVPGLGGVGFNAGSRCSVWDHSGRICL